MTHAKLGSRIIEATIRAPATATCIHCGAMVVLRLAAGMTGPLWFHVTDKEAAECAREREAEQTETKG